MGSASAIAEDGLAVGAIVAVNSFGSVVAPGGRAFWAAPYEIGDEFGGLGAAGPRRRARRLGAGQGDQGAAGRTNTTIACVATDATLSVAETQRVAIMAQDGLARAIRPAHAPFDGDVVFALATGRQPSARAAPYGASPGSGALAADCLARAIARGVYAATPWPGVAATSAAGGILHGDSAHPVRRTETVLIGPAHCTTKGMILQHQGSSCSSRPA